MDGTHRTLPSRETPLAIENGKEGRQRGGKSARRRSEDANQLRKGLRGRKGLASSKRVAYSEEPATLRDKWKIDPHHLMVRKGKTQVLSQPLSSLPCPGERPWRR